MYNIFFIYFDLEITIYFFKVRILKKKMGGLEYLIIVSSISCIICQFIQILEITKQWSECGISYNVSLIDLDCKGGYAIFLKLYLYNERPLWFIYLPILYEQIRMKNYFSKFYYLKACLQKRKELHYCVDRDISRHIIIPYIHLYSIYGNNIILYYVSRLR